MYLRDLLILAEIRSINMIKDRWNELRIKASQFSSDRTSIAVDDLHDFDKVYPTSQSTFFNKVHEIRKILAGLAADIAEVKIRLHSLPAQTIFDGREKEKLDECLRAIKYRSNLLRGHLLAMQRNEKEVEKEQQTDSDITARIRKCHIEAMIKTLSVLIEKLNSAQLDYRIQVLKKIKRQLVIAGEHMTDDEINAIVDSESPEIFNRQFRSSQLKSALASVTVRHAGFVNLEKSMKELHHLYNDFAFLVHSQVVPVIPATLLSQCINEMLCYH
ncbi:unnamed protein product [Thelazia callipaeda]|uniref:SynN domain-containing protein n=1 Tax=Thelazia callipaeda TaxID=103827 RepID=A0A0N5CK35_THECL|nr:unnamed protein product [Thelazia callipaeda]